MQYFTPKIFLGCLLCALSAGIMSGCNTIAGVGQDTEALGRSVQNAADHAKH